MQSGKLSKSLALMPAPLPLLLWAHCEWPGTPQLMQGRLATARRYASERTGAAFGMGAAAVVVVLTAEGEVLQKQVTTVGGN